MFGVLLGVVGVAFWLKAEPVVEELTETRVLEVLDRLLAKTAFSEFALLPSYWLSSAILQWSEGALETAAFYGLVLLSYTLFFGHLSLSQTGRFFYDGKGFRKELFDDLFELLRNDVLVAQTGCSAIACGKAGLLRPEAAFEQGDR